MSFPFQRSITPPPPPHFFSSSSAAPLSRRVKVNGQLSQTCYLRALDSCYDRLAAKKTKQGAAAVDGKDRPFALGDVENVLCHSPYNKLVQKSFARMAFSDARRLRKGGFSLGEGQEEALGKWLDVPVDVRVSSFAVLSFCVGALRFPRSVWNGLVPRPGSMSPVVAGEGARFPLSCGRFPQRTHPVPTQHAQRAAPCGRSLCRRCAHFLQLYTFSAAWQRVAPRSKAMVGVLFACGLTAGS